MFFFAMEKVVVCLVIASLQAGYSCFSSFLCAPFFLGLCTIRNGIFFVLSNNDSYMHLFFGG
jgi:hypothetical protein